MKKHFKKYMLIFYFTYFTLLFSQVNNNFIIGYIYDAETYEPLIGVNIFISGSFWGTTSDKSGYYYINSLPSGNHEIVASIIGYSPSIKIVKLVSHQNLEINYYLDKKIYTLDDVIIESEYPEDWHENLETFKNFFLGQSVFSEECIIENEIKINFTNKKNEILSANIEEPLIIKNNSLGYEIECYLFGFEYDKKDKICTYYTKTKFKNLKPNNQSDSVIWKKNREKAYFGSFRHFLKTLFQKNIFEREFETFKVTNTHTIPVEYDSLVVSNQKYENQVIIKFDQSLAVEYLNFSRRERIVSWIKCLTDSVTIDKYGEPNEILPFQISGFWATKGIADLLPKDFSISQ